MWTLDVWNILQWHYLLIALKQVAYRSHKHDLKYWSPCNNFWYFTCILVTLKVEQILYTYFIKKSVHNKPKYMSNTKSIIFIGFEYIYIYIHTYSAMVMKKKLMLPISGWTPHYVFPSPSSLDVITASNNLRMKRAESIIL